MSCRAALRLRTCLTLLLAWSGLLALLLVSRFSVATEPVLPPPDVLNAPAIGTPPLQQTNVQHPSLRAAAVPALDALFDSVRAVQYHHAVDNTTQRDLKVYCEEQRDRVWQRLETHANPYLVSRLREQRAMHERVARGKAPPDQKYLIWSLSGGLGNRFLSMTSSFMVAVVSRRVFLMKDWFTPLPPGTVKQKPHRIPSPNSPDYLLEDLTKLFGDTWPVNEELLCPLLPMMNLRDFAQLYPQEFDLTNHANHAKVDIAARHDKQLKRWDRFLCTRLPATAMDMTNATEPTRRHAGIRGNVTFFQEKYVYVWTNQYYLPVLYANPYHTEEMKRMFPSGQPYQDIVSFLVIPSLPVVRRLRSFFDTEAQRGQGLQLTGATSDYESLQIRAFRTNEVDRLARDFDKCWTASSAGGQKSNAPFFLATMFSDVRSYFVRRYGPRVRVMSTATEHQLTSNATADQEALTDMMIMAFARRLFVSPGSTFGMFVAAYARRFPIAVREKGACRLIRNAEPCFGSWFRRDHLLRRSSELNCRLSVVPSTVINCEQS